jgi:hypothetical protein
MSVLGALLVALSASCSLLLGETKQGLSDAGSPADASGLEEHIDATDPPADGSDARLESDVQGGVDAQGGSDAAVGTDSGGGGGDGATSSEASSAMYATTCTRTGTAACTCGAPDPGNPAAGNDTECDTTAVPGSVCCADANWPAAGSACTCLTASCTQEPGGGCDCSLGSDGQTCNMGVVCCVAPSPQQECLCTFGVNTCWQGYRQVQQCDAPAIGCGANNQVVSCSVPASR